MIVKDFSGRDSFSRRILVVDDDRDSLDIIMEPLRWEGYDIRGFTNSVEAAKTALEWKPHIILLDWVLENTSGIEFLHQVRQELPNTSIIFVSGINSTEAIIEGLDNGADDYICKPFVPLELLARVRTHLRIRDLAEQLIDANSKLKELVDIDDLTGLYNMRSMFSRLEYELERARRFGREVCVVMMDMDRFKSVNDGHDHLFGSYVISEVGRIIRDNTRNIDLPARYGGDEFMIVLTEVGHDGAMLFCERLRMSVEKTTFSNGPDSIKLTLSLGFAITGPGEDIDAKELVRRADHALYEAKRSGRNRTCFWKPEIDSARKPRPIEPFKKPGEVKPLVPLKPLDAYTQDKDGKKPADPNKKKAS